MLRIACLLLIAALAACSRESPPRQEETSASSEDSLTGYDLARAAYLEGRYQEATQLAEAYLEEEPQKHQARFLLAQSLLENGRPDDATRQAALLPPTPERLWLMARISFDTGRDDATIAFTAQVLDVYPDNHEARYLMGRAELRAGHLEHAVVSFQPLAEQQPAFDQSQMHLANAWRRLGETARADSLVSAFGRTQRWREAMQLQNEGVSRSDTGELDVALDYLQRALELEPDDPEIYNDLGTVYARLQRYEEAEAAFTRASGLDPDNATVYRNLANLYHLTQNAELRDAALAKFRELTEDDAAP